MPEYEANLYYRGFMIKKVNAENEEEAIENARAEQDAPLNQNTYIKSFEPILETLEPWKECDTARLKQDIRIIPRNSIKTFSTYVQPK